MARRTLSEEPVAARTYDGFRAPASEPPEQKRGGGALVGVLVFLLIGALAWAIVATWFVGDESAGPEAGITLSELSSDPDGLIGSTVVVSGEISDVVGQEDEAITAQTGAATGFVLGEEGQSVLVVGSRIPQLAALRGDEELANGDIVQVTGTVREFDRAALEEELGADLVEDEFTAFESRPVLMASAVTLVPTTARQQGEQIALSADELTDSPGEYLTQQITVRDFTADDPADILSPRAVVLDDDILVIGGAGPTNVEAGFTGTVTGTLIEASSARLLNSINVPQGTDANGLFEKLGIDEQQFGQYEYVLVANRFQPGS